MVLHYTKPWYIAGDGIVEYKKGRGRPSEMFIIRTRLWYHSGQLMWIAGTNKTVINRSLLALPPLAHISRCIVDANMCNVLGELECERFCEGYRIRYTVLYPQTMIHPFPKIIYVILYNTIYCILYRSCII